MEITLPFLGRHFVPNALSAIAAASLFGIELEKVKEALEHLSPFPMRMEVLALKEGVTPDQRCLQCQSKIDGTGPGDPFGDEGKGQGHCGAGRYAGTGRIFRGGPSANSERRLESFPSIFFSLWGRRHLSLLNRPFVMDWIRRGQELWRAIPKPLPY